MNIRNWLLPVVSIALAGWIADSRGLFVLLSVGGALLVDRHTHRRLGWSGPSDTSPTESHFRAPRFILLAWLMAPWIVGVVNVAILAAIDYGPLPWREIAYLLYCSACGVTVVQWLLHRAARNRRGWRRALAVSSGCLTLAGLTAFFAPVIAYLHPPRRMARNSPVELGLAFETVAFRTADGVRLGGWFIPAADARGTVIYCHGVTSNCGQVRDLLPTLHELGLNVLAFDFRGHGQSDGHTLYFGTREVEDLLAAQKFVRDRAPSKPIMLLGASYGAAMTLTSLDRMPDVACAWTESSFARFPHLAEHRFRALSPTLRSAMIRLQFLAAWLDTGYWFQDVNPIEHLARSRVPMMFLHGRRDQVIPFSEGESLFAACAGPKDHLWVDEANHYDVLTVSYDEYLRQLRKFVETYLPRKR